ncbi:TonB-dependent receptor [Galbibacter pacificus]|uniref:TonB-dependent receptor n=1 Tax=Galbibacter pacificus TaxID=2996052 RepID=A0ABT6FSK6_9FLAO|nr:TonB-dependent receptor [Galbibacter pacificus]MDG3582635.1 TonB-dependent receptor [Galbibacter pacificus]MDG3586246.1 TonB-dependent receptor [Galbibacter pacificus]
MIRTIFFVLTFLFSALGVAQTTISGKVVDEQNQPIPGANVQVMGTTVGTVTDFEGNFSLSIEDEYPFNIKVSSIGFAPQTIALSTARSLQIQLKEETTNLGEIVISASRTPERIFESPVTVERFGLKEIKNTASVDFYDGLENLKGVDINTNSLTFKSINTRGFAAFANTRFVQLIDGMDNAAPALNFPLGNLLGMTEIDVQSVELLPGASSALYGANAFNGILFMRSKSPFDFEGISAYAKSGMTSQEAAGDNVFWDLGIRVAKKFSDKFAAKANFSYLKGTDWFAVSQENVLNPGTGREMPDYDGLNVYGDEVSTNIRAVGIALAENGIIPEGAVNLLPNENVSRTGYLESNLTNYEAESVKFDAALHYRPFADDLEIIYQGKIGKGATIYQGSNRYSLKNFFLQQHKIEVRNDNFFVRGYMTDEDAGDSYDMRFTGINVNRYWKGDQQWFGEYAGAYVQATLSGASSEQAHTIARQTADTGRLIPGTPEFQQAFNTVTTNPDLASGSQFRDGSQLYHADANYNFSHLVDFADIQVGGSFRTYRLNSFGTIFTDYDGPISYNELGLYTQIQKQLMDERLKLTGSLRYDKSELFNGQVTPRFSVGYTAGENRNHNFRASIQTAFRNPTTQDLYIGLDVGRAILVGSAEDNLDRYVRTFDVNNQAANGGNPTATISGRNAYENSFSAASVQAGAPVASDVDLVKPEQAIAYEIGYRGQLGKVSIDLSGYYTDYTDFIATQNVVAPLYGEVGDNSQSLVAIQSGDYKVFQTYTNAKSGVQSYGASIAVSTKVFNGFDLSGNYTYADFDQDDPEFRAGFNTPKHKFKASFGHTELVKNFGFNFSYRWSDAFFWQAGFGDGNIPSITVMDAQLNYTVPSIKSIFKVGAANLSGEEYYTAYGTGLIGTQLYVSWTINNF